MAELSMVDKIIASAQAVWVILRHGGEAHQILHERHKILIRQERLLHEILEDCHMIGASQLQRMLKRLRMPVRTAGDLEDLQAEWDAMRYPNTHRTD